MTGARTDALGVGGEPVLEVERLGVWLGGSEVLRDVSLRLERGQFGCLIGPNGGGKTTLLKVVAGLVQPAEGRVVSRADRIGYVPQQVPMDPALPLTVREFLSLRLVEGPFWFGGRGRAMAERIRGRLAETGAAHLIDRRLGQLSGGEFQRVLVAYALLCDPDLLLLDEPTTGMDLRGGLSLDGLLHHLHDHRRIAVLMVSHDLHLVEHVGEVVYCLNRTVCCAGRPREVLRPENLAQAYGHPHGLVPARGADAFIPVEEIR